MTENLGRPIILQSRDHLEIAKILRSLTNELELLAGESSDIGEEDFLKFTLCTFLGFNIKFTAVALFTYLSILL